MLAILLSCIFKKVDEEEDEEDANNVMKPDEEPQDPILVNGKYDNWVQSTSRC